MGAQARTEEPRGFGKRGSVRLSQTRKAATAGPDGAAGNAMTREDGQANPSDFDMPSSSTRANLMRQCVIAAGMLLIGLPVLAGLFSGFFRQTPNEQSSTSASSSEPTPAVLPGSAGHGETVTRGRYGANGAHDVGTGG